MSLSTVLYTAQNSLFNLSQKASVAARNISGASDPNYARRVVVLETAENGAAIVSVDRAANNRLASASRDALSLSVAQGTISENMRQLALSLNGSDGSASASALLSKLHEALQNYSASPGNELLARGVVNAAGTLAGSLNASAAEIHTMRARLDREIAGDVETLNGLLAEFQGVNTAIVKANLQNADASDLLDRRDTLLGRIAEIVPVTVTARAHGDVMLTTAGGVMLFETTARDVTFTPRPAYGPGDSGNVLRIDGVPLDPGTGTDTSSSGSIAARLQLRDDVTVRTETQLDEIARGLVTLFAETDQTGGGLPPQAGLFTWSGGPAVPAGGVLASGMAATLTVNPLFDPQAGGTPSLLRDGGANGAAYVANASGGAAFSDRIIALADAMEAPMAFDPSTGLAATGSIIAFSGNALTWLEAYRAESGVAAETKEAMHAALSSKLLAQTGVNIDDEMASLVEIEHSYEATSRIIATVDNMLAALLEAAR
ncbi:MAG: flagellar hook-associated protein FlgK [Phyllobacteriaceae bacterium]|nr:flagellar hook-associated protein FlgK [Phyllobacteriaceae bacterium]MBA93222.1 flagellar hook-associated protein FlgK [Phyllobacteriaceae bacterium]